MRRERGWLFLQEVLGSFSGGRVESEEFNEIENVGKLYTRRWD